MERSSEGRENATVADRGMSFHSTSSTSSSSSTHFLLPQEGGTMNNTTTPTSAEDVNVDPFGSTEMVVPKSKKHAEISISELTKRNGTKVNNATAPSSSSSSSSSSANHRQITYHQMQCFVKPSLGSDEKAITPLQISFPYGATRLALPIQKKADQTNNPNSPNRARNLAGRVAVSSHPEHSDEAISRQNSLCYAFQVFALMNFLFTCILFGMADSVDESKIQYDETSNGLPGSFEEVGTSRTNNENAGFAFTILFIILGSISALMKSPLGLSIYSICVSVMLVLSMGSAPYFVYCFRYILDILMLYIAQELRAHLVVSFLSLHNSPPDNS
jgi:hypothetical protein